MTKMNIECSFTEEASSGTYKVGDVFIVDGDLHVLAQVLAGECCLVSLSSGNRYEDPVRVGDIYSITADEMGVMSVHGDYKHVASANISYSL